MKFLIATAVALGIAAVAYGAAASLGPLHPNSLGAADADVTACDDTGLGVDWSDGLVLYDGQLVVESVEVGVPPEFGPGISPFCNGLELLVILTEDGTELDRGTVVISGAPDPQTVVMDDGTSAPASAINDIHVAIYTVAEDPD